MDSGWSASCTGLAGTEGEETAPLTETSSWKTSTPSMIFDLTCVCVCKNFQYTTLNRITSVYNLCRGHLCNPLNVTMSVQRKQGALLLVVADDLVRLLFGSHNAGALTGVREVPQPYGAVCAPSEDHGTVVNNASGQAPHTVVLQRLGGGSRRYFKTVSL